jgi:hypothetical protein
MEVNGVKPETRGTARLPTSSIGNFWYLLGIIGDELRRVSLLEISIYLTVYLSIYLPVCLSVCLSV